MDEIWKDIYYVDIITDEIIDYRGKYQVSNFGRVKSLNYNRSGKEKELNYTKDKDGYLIVSLNRRKFKVHRLVAYVFIANRFAKQDEDDSVFLRNYEKMVSSIPEIGLGIYECPYPYKRLMSPETLRTCFCRLTQIRIGVA